MLPDKSVVFRVSRIGLDAALQLCICTAMLWRSHAPCLGEDRAGQRCHADFCVSMPEKVTLPVRQGIIGGAMESVKNALGYGGNSEGQWVSVALPCLPLPCTITTNPTQR